MSLKVGLKTLAKITFLLEFIYVEFICMWSYMLSPFYLLVFTYVNF